MRVRFGNIPKINDFRPEAEGLQDIRGFKESTGIILAGLTGCLLLFFPILVLSMILSYFAIQNPSSSPQDQPVPWGVAALGVLLFIPLHELLHLVWHPGFLKTDQSILVIWPKKLRFGVYYEGDMSRTRWLLMRFSPFLFLSLVPAVALALLQNININEALSTWFYVIMILSGVGSGGDIVAMLLVMRQVPPSGMMCFRSGRAFWKSSSSI